MKSKKRWFVTALTACLTLSLGICAEALEYYFDGVEDTECYPSTSYESLYGAKYNYGGSNATDYQWPALPYGVSSNTSVGCMEKVRFPGLVGSIGGSGIESNITNPIQQEPQIPSTSYQPSAYTSVDGMERKDGSILSEIHYSRIWTLPRWNDGLSFPDEGLLSKRVCIGSIAPPYICAYRRAGIFCGLFCILDQKSRRWQKDGNAARCCA